MLTSSGLSECFAPVEVDTRPCHPDIVFFQDRGSKYTVAVDVDTRTVVGESPRDGVPSMAVHRVMREVKRFQNAG